MYERSIHFFKLKEKLDRTSPDVGKLNAPMIR